MYKNIRLWLHSVGSKISRFTVWIGSIGVSSNDGPELKSHKIILTIALYATVSNLLYFSFEYINIDRENTALVLMSFSIYLMISAVLFSYHRNFIIFRELYFVGLFLYMIIYHSVMGGYIGSVVYINYGIPVMAGVQMLYQKKTHRISWYIIYMITVIVLFFLEPIISRGMVPLSDRIILLTHVNNFVLIASLIFLSYKYYTTIIETEKSKSDTLIRNILPEPVVKELNSKGRSNPIMIPMATAIFMDFVGFTRITQEMEPKELVANLNEHFSNFDKVFVEHNVEKLKTIGDGYMAVGGLPEPNNSHALDVALAAMKVLGYMDIKNRENGNDWKIRIGIHTGPMVAGIIGETKFSYDVWGSTVNLCSRLETASKPGFINVSDEYMKYTKDFFEFEPRGQIEIKNGKPVNMYFLTDIRKELRSGHFQPNERFFEMYNNNPILRVAQSKDETA